MEALRFLKKALRRELSVSNICLLLSFPVQHDQPDQTNENPSDIDPRDLVLEKENRDRDEDQRGCHCDQRGGDAQVPAGAVHEQVAKFDANDRGGESEAGPIEFAEFGREAVLNGEEKEGEQGDDERDSIGHQKGDGEIHVLGCAFGDEMI